MAKKVRNSAEAQAVEFEPFTVEMEFDDPEDTEHILLGLIVARSNNSNPFFVGLIDDLNEGMTDYRRGRVTAPQS